MEEPKNYPILDIPPAAVTDFMPKEPFARRANPLINSESPQFKSMERYFQYLLRDTKHTIDEILQHTFDEHEIRLFEPVTGPPELVQLQASNTLRFRNILNTRFKGRTSTLHLKMTFLFFGLPVAPMKPGGFQEPLDTDLDFGQDAVVFRSDPLQFLDHHTERTYGDHTKRVTSTHFFRTPPVQSFASVGLRGGSLAEGNIPEEEEEEDEPVVSIYGFQGIVHTYLGYENFRSAVDHLLGARSGRDYQIRLQIWDWTKDEAQLKKETTGVLFHTKVPDRHDEIKRTLDKWIDAKTVDTHVVFVSYDLEDKPSYCQPENVDWEVVSLVDQTTARIQYMRVPPSIQASTRPNQFVGQYLRTMQCLYQNEPHQFIQFKSGLAYGMLDPPRQFWDEIIDMCGEEGRTSVPELPLTTISVPPEYVPVLVPGFYNYSTDFSPKDSNFTHDDLRIRRSEEDRTSLAKLTNVLYAAHPKLRNFENDLSIDVWAPGQDFMNATIPGHRVDLDYEDLVFSPASWHLFVHEFRRLRLYSNKNNLSVVVRPVYRSYQIHAGDDPQYQFPFNINDATLAEFKAAVRNHLFQGYNGNQEGEVLYLQQTTWVENQTDFVITSTMDEKDWKFITRRITEQDITVFVQNWSSDQDVDISSEWGPRYDYTYPGEITSIYENPDQPKPKPYDEKMEKLFAESDFGLNGAIRAQTLRQKFFWSDPSIFTNPTKPSMPLGAPPIETLIKTGPNVPAFTTGMRTPSEVARLEKEVHSLRGNLLSRIRECPFIDCQRYFTFADSEGLARHIREDHTNMKCFLCPENQVSQTWINQYDSSTIRRHFIDDHYDELKAFFDVAGADGSIPGLGFCSRCGRDRTKLSNPTDSAQHKRQCQRGLRALGGWCPCCGEKTSQFQECPCGEHIDDDPDNPDFGRFCNICGLEWDGTMSLAYRERHKKHCKRPGGLIDDYCSWCGVDLKGVDADGKKRHREACPKKPDGQHGHAASARVVEDDFVLNTGTGDGVVVDHDTVLDLLTPNIRIEETNERRSKSNVKKDNRKPAKPESVSGARKRATRSEQVPPRRGESPLWDSGSLEDPYEPYGFLPEPQWRCSRCFRCAGMDVDEIEGHSAESGSCRIRRGLGTTKTEFVPNRSGWIATPDDDFDFQAAYFKFVNKYPAYRHTMFPARQENVKKVWEEPYRFDTAVGESVDDPNYRGRGADPEAVRAGDLPWPPYEGLVVPPKPEELNEPEVKSESDSNIGALATPASSSWKPFNKPLSVKPLSDKPLSEDISTLTSIESDDWSYESLSEAGRKRKYEELDATFQATHGITESELSEEYSEADAVPDPIANLDIDAPRTPKKRTHKPKKVRIKSPSNKSGETPSFLRMPPPNPKPSSSGPSKPHKSTSIFKSEPGPKLATSEERIAAFYERARSTRPEPPKPEKYAAFFEPGSGTKPPYQSKFLSMVEERNRRPSPKPQKYASFFEPGSGVKTSNFPRKYGTLFEPKEPPPQSKPRKYASAMNMPSDIFQNPLQGPGTQPPRPESSAAPPVKTGLEGILGITAAGKPLDFRPIVPATDKYTSMFQPPPGVPSVNPFQPQPGVPSVNPFQKQQAGAERAGSLPASTRPHSRPTTGDGRPSTSQSVASSWSGWNPRPGSSASRKNLLDLMKMSRDGFWFGGDK